jgi:hypothetical protein
MEAHSVSNVPVGAQWQYEPKWDGFRCILARDGNEVAMTSKSGQDLTRYFPEVAEAARSIAERNFVLDGEIVIPIGKSFSFEALLQRIHPAESRIHILSTQTPARFMAFDLLQRGRRDLAREHLPERRAELEDFADGYFRKTLFALSPATVKYKWPNVGCNLPATAATASSPKTPRPKPESSHVEIGSSGEFANRGGTESTRRARAFAATYTDSAHRRRSEQRASDRGRFASRSKSCNRGGRLRGASPRETQTQVPHLPSTSP